MNPHDSLLYRDIVTPSRELDSSDCLLLHSPDESDIVSYLFQVKADVVTCYQMAPKRSLYGDLTSAYSSITKRAEDSPDDIRLKLPFPPTPAVLNGNSTAHPSPTVSVESNLTVSPLDVKKPGVESRFSIAQLTRSLTKKLVRTPEMEPHELQDVSKVRIASTNLDGRFPRSLYETYGTDAPLSPFDLAFNDVSSIPQRSSEQESVEAPRHYMQRVEVKPLSSMIPDDPSAQIQRPDSPHPYDSPPEGDLGSRPYYDDMASIYPGSSVYSRDGDGNLRYPSSLYSKRMSNPFGPISPETDQFSSDYNRDSIYSYAPSKRTSRRVSRPLTDNYHHHSKPLGNNTDTISKFIDQYDQGDITSSFPLDDSAIAEQSASVERRQPSKNASGFSQFDFGLQDGDDMCQSEVAIVSPIQQGHERKPIITHVAGPPPRTLAPLAPAFEYDEEPKSFPHLNSSEIFSGASTYGDTHHLLHLSPSKAEDTGALKPPVSPPALEPPLSYSQSPNRPHPLEPSSSYSQPSIQTSPHTPQEALDQAEKIFGAAVVGNNDAEIPAIWARRHSGNLLRRNGHSATIASDNNEDSEEEKGDWETVRSDGQQARYSLDDSIADYSSTEGGSRDSLGFQRSDSLPGLDQSIDRDSSFYHHPSPLPPHPHPFSSSPPHLDAGTSHQSASGEVSSNEFSSSPPFSSNIPLFHARNVNAGELRSSSQPYHYGPRAAPLQFTLSDKETQELLNSGPNEEILYESGNDTLDHISSSGSQQEPPNLRRENTFEKISFLGPKGNLTGTPLGTGMRETGSSVADTSSPGVPLSSSPFDKFGRSRGSPGFYMAPDRTMSITKIRTSRAPPTPQDHDRSPSETTLFPGLQQIQLPPEPSPSFVGRRQLAKSPTVPGRRASRAAVNGQTKLRDMVLAPSNESVSSSQATRISHFMREHSARPSTSNTHTPLRPIVSEASLKPNLASQHSPHLLCPERALDPEAEEERRKASWLIFGLFCLLPPMLILYRWLGDYAIVSWTKGRLGHCSEKPKRIALGAGIVVNISLVTLILLPIIIAHAAGAL